VPERKRDIKPDFRRNNPIRVKTKIRYNEPS
jgi:hypothetical protein